MQFGSVIPYETDHLSDPIEIPDESPTPAAIRAAHFRTETSVKTIGSLLWIYVGLGCLAMLGLALSMDGLGLLPILLGVSLLTASAIGGALLRKLDPRGRWIYTLLFLVHLALLGIAAKELILTLQSLSCTRCSYFPTDAQALSVVLIPYVVHGFFLYVLWSREGRTVMGRHYRHTIIPATPHIR
jgi:hypothetical protein